MRIGAWNGRDDRKEARAGRQRRRDLAQRRKRLARTPSEHVRRDLDGRVSGSVEDAWRALTDPTETAHLIEGTVLAVCRVPGTPRDQPGEITCVVWQDDDGVTRASLEELVHVEVGRRAMHRSWAFAHPTSTGFSLEPDGPDSCTVHLFADIDSHAGCAWNVAQVAEGGLARTMWRLARHLARPDDPPVDEPADVPLVSDAKATQRERLRRLQEGPLVDADVIEIVDLPVPLHAAWVLVNAHISPVAERGDPWAWAFPAGIDDPDPRSPIRIGLHRHPLGWLEVVPWERLDVVPGERLVTRGLDPWDVDAIVRLDPSPTGTRVVVELFRPVLLAGLAGARATLKRRASAYAARLRRAASNTPAPDLDEAWVW